MPTDTPRPADSRPPATEPALARLLRGLSGSLWLATGAPFADAFMNAVQGVPPDLALWPIIPAGGGIALLLDWMVRRLALPPA